MRGAAAPVRLGPARRGPARRGPARVAGWALLGARLGFGALALARLARAARRSPPVTPATDGAPESISVVVPARDEAERIGPCLAALAADPAVDEVVVVDDESRDATASVAAAHGARVVRGTPPPPGWAGKPWALQQGLEAATGTWVVTLDADTEPAPGLAAALVARCRDEGYDLVTAAGRAACPTPGVAWLHPALLTTLVYRFGPPGATVPARPHRLVANGQCMAFRRQALLGIGGLGVVRGSLVEDVALVRWLARHHWRVGFVDAAGALRVTPYASLADTWRGWGRSLALEEVTGPGWLALDLGVVWAAQALPLLRLLAGRADLVDVVLLAARLGTLAGTRRAYERPGPAYWCSPLADGLAAARLTQVALRPERTWRGRTYPRRDGAAP